MTINSLNNIKFWFVLFCMWMSRKGDHCSNLKTSRIPKYAKFGIREIKAYYSNSTINYYTMLSKKHND
jgi:hypothetical protein